MRSRGSGGQCYVDSGIYQNLHAPRIRQRQNTPGERKQIPSGQIFFADLNPVRSLTVAVQKRRIRTGQGARDRGEQSHAGGQ